MAEILLNVGSSGPDPNYQDGDIVCAFNDKRIQRCHANEICHIRKAVKGPGGVRSTSSLAYKFREIVSEFKFTRVTPTEVERLSLRDSTSEVLGPLPNSRGEAIDVPVFIARRLLHDTHGLFGTPGSEIWFGGRTYLDQVQIDAVWNMIETESPNRRSDFDKWPLTPTERKHFLGIRVMDFTDQEAALHVEPEIQVVENTRVIMRRRKRAIPWRDLPLGIPEAWVTNRNKEVDVRIATMNIVPHLIEKPVRVP